MAHGVVIVVVVYFQAHQCKAAGMKVEAKQNTNGYNDAYSVTI